MYRFAHQRHPRFRDELLLQALGAIFARTLKDAEAAARGSAMAAGAGVGAVDEGAGPLVDGALLTPSVLRCMQELADRVEPEIGSYNKAYAPLLCQLKEVLGGGSGGGTTSAPSSSGAGRGHGVGDCGPCGP
jgi:hypothetical protein